MITTANTKSVPAGGRVSRDAILRARCSQSLKERLQRVAVLNEKDVSDLIRDAVLERVLAFEQRMRAA